jgi:hypothetical protein
MDLHGRKRLNRILWQNLLLYQPGNQQLLHQCYRQRDRCLVLMLRLYRLRGMLYMQQHEQSHWYGCLWLVRLRLLLQRLYDKQHNLPLSPRLESLLFQRYMDQRGKKLRNRL